MATEMDHQIVKDLKAAGIDYITSVPCKQLAGAIEVLDETPEIMHMPSNKEDEGMGL